MKDTYLISYDLSNGKEDYEVLRKYFESFKTWAHITESLWAVYTDKKPSDIRDEILEKIPKDSKIIIIKSGVRAAWSNVICSNEWLQKYL